MKYNFILKLYPVTPRYTIDHSMVVLSNGRTNPLAHKGLTVERIAEVPNCKSLCSRYGHYKNKASHVHDTPAGISKKETGRFQNYPTESKIIFNANL